MKPNKIPLGKILSHYLSQAKQHGWILVFLIIAPILAELCDLLPQYVLKDLVNMLLKTDASSLTSVFLKTAMWLFLLITLYKCVQFLLFRISTFCMIRMERKVMYGLVEKAFCYIHGHSMSFFQDNFVGSMVKQMYRYADAFEQIVDQAVWTFLPVLAQIIFGQIMLFSIHWIFGVAMLVWTLVFTLASIALSRYKLPYDFEESQASSHMTGHLSDSLSNVLAVKISAGFQHEYEVFTQVALTHDRVRGKKWMMSFYIDTVQGALVVLVETVLLYVAIQLVYQGVITPGDVVLVLGVSVALFRRLWGIGRAIGRVYTSCADAYEMMKILETPHGIQDKLDAQELRVTGGRVDFHDVDFAYGTHTLMKDFSLHIKAGERIALVGHSGAGKSTLIKLLLRFHDVTGGRICIDGQDIMDVTQESLHQHVAFVPQEPVLFHRTIGENISYGRPDATKAEIIHAAKRAHAHEFISRFPQGYDTFVGERGVKLSGGERQRVAIARALLSKAPILILDEATSALDSESESLIKDALHTLMLGKTTIVVAHRLSTIMEMDRILVLEAGVLVEQGTHQQLLDQGGIYHTLWSIQSGGFLGE